MDTSVGALIVNMAVANYIFQLFYVVLGYISLFPFTFSLLLFSDPVVIRVFEGCRVFISVLFFFFFNMERWLRGFRLKIPRTKIWCEITELYPFGRPWGWCQKARCWFWEELRLLAFKREKRLRFTILWKRSSTTEDRDQKNGNKMKQEGFND